MFIRFRQTKAERYGDGARLCAGKCKDRPRYYARYGVGCYVQGRSFLEGCPMKPICPLAKPRARLEVSIVVTRREGRKVKQQHIASLGSIAGDDIEARILFWELCNERLARLANRIGPDMDRLRQAIAARIPEPTSEEIDKLEMDRWQRVQTGWQGLVDGDHQQIANAESEIAEMRERIARTQPIVDMVTEVMKDVQSNMARGNRSFVEEAAQERHAVNMTLGKVLAMRVFGSRAGKDLLEEAQSKPNEPTPREQGTGNVDIHHTPRS